jgi:hypothetical protein
VRSRPPLTPRDDDRTEVVDYVMGDRAYVYASGLAAWTSAGCAS